MTTRQELLDQWQQRLADAELACEATVVPAWSDRLRVKLYRFLLAMYGHTDWPGPQDDVDNSQERAANAQLTVAEPKEEFAGKQPRSRAEILQGLRNVKGLGEELAPAGPLIDGLLPDSPVIVATFKKQYPANVAVRKLKRCGLDPVLARNGNHFQIYVLAARSTEAVALLSEPTPKIRTPAVQSDFQPGRAVALVWSLFFFGIGCAMLGSVLYAVACNWSGISTVPLTDLDGLTMCSFIFFLVAYQLFRRGNRCSKSTLPPPSLVRKSR